MLFYSNNHPYFSPRLHLENSDTIKEPLVYYIIQGLPQFSNRVIQSPPTQSRKPETTNFRDIWLLPASSTPPATKGQRPGAHIPEHPSRFNFPPFHDPVRAKPDNNVAIRRRKTSSFHEHPASAATSSDRTKGRPRIVSRRRALTTSPASTGGEKEKARGKSRGPILPPFPVFISPAWLSRIPQCVISFAFIRRTCSRLRSRASIQCRETRRQRDGNARPRRRAENR